jgi:tetratricopeptide (TPR) repeat protein
LEWNPNFTAVSWSIGIAYVQQSNYKEGLAEMEKDLAISPGNAAALSEIGHAYAVAGRKLEAQKVLGQLDEISKQKFVTAAFMAIIYAGLEERDKAFEQLELGYKERSLGGGAIILSDPGFDPLRSDPRFADLLRRMNLQP